LVSNVNPTLMAISEIVTTGYRPGRATVFMGIMLP